MIRALFTIAVRSLALGDHSALSVFWAAPVVGRLSLALLVVRFSSRQAVARPLTVALASHRFPAHAAWISSMMALESTR